MAEQTALCFFQCARWHGTLQYETALQRLQTMCFFMVSLDDWPQLAQIVRITNASAFLVWAGSFGRIVIRSINFATSTGSQ